MKSLIIVLLSVSIALASNDAVLQEFVNANNLFAAEFYKQIVQKNEPNFLISPYSAEAVLAFLHSGSKDETAQEIRKALHFPEDNNQIESAVKESLSALTGNDLYTLHTANKMYVLENYPIKEEFRKAATAVYHADIENINFLLKEAAAKMNNWVEEQTNNKIKNLINPDSLNELTRAILINAIYFKGNWSNSFDTAATSKRDFYKSNKNVLQVDAMQNFYAEFNYAENSEINAKFLELPFQGGDASMVIVLPDDREGLNSLENQIGKVFAPQKLQQTVLNVVLPKFKIESKLALVELLQNLGMKRPFDSSQADLSGIAGKKGDLYISDVLQKTYIQVDEKGVEAAAATYVEILGNSHIPPKEFIADHPFIFYIKAKNFILFAGRVSEPSL